MTAQGTMDSLPGQVFYFYIANLIALSIDSARFMIDTYAWSAPILTIDAKENELHVLKEEVPIQMPRHIFNYDSTINSVR